MKVTAGSRASVAEPGDEVLVQDGEMSTSGAHGAGFFGLSWPKDIGGQDLPSVYDVIVDEELAAAGAALIAPASLSIPA